MSRHASKVALFVLLLSLSGSGPTSAAAPTCSINGTAGRDVIRGTPGPDTICSLGGADLVYGGGGDDRILAGSGDDRVFGGAGHDELLAGAGADRVDGGAGNDRILAGLGRDSLVGGAGHDLFHTRDGARDALDGGVGRNLAVVDASDRVRRNSRVAALPKPGGPRNGVHIVAAAGDIACDPLDDDFENGLGDEDECHQLYTSDLVVAMRPDAVLIPGDHQYENGTYEKYLRSFHRSWGRLKHLIRPSIGNHEYDDPAGGASGYFRYYGAAAGDPTRAYYSFDVGPWHMISLNSECGRVGGCGSESPQQKWLQADLTANPTKCTLAFFHHPRFSSGQHGSSPHLDPLWRQLHAAGVDVVLNGHDHNYERFAPVDPTGAREPGGIRQFIVGMGGKNLRGFATVHPASEARDATTFGVLKLTLRPTSYNWEFMGVEGKGFRDSGTAACR